MRGVNAPPLKTVRPGDVVRIGEGGFDDDSFSLAAAAPSSGAKFARMKVNPFIAGATAAFGVMACGSIDSYVAGALPAVVQNPVISTVSPVVPTIAAAFFPSSANLCPEVSEATNHLPDSCESFPLI